MLAAILCLAPPCFLSATDPFIETAGFALLYIGFGAILMLALERGHGRRISGAVPDIPGHHGDQRTPVSFSSGARSAATTVRRALASFLAWVGVYSYSIYLWHLAVKKWVVPAIVHGLGWSEGGIVTLLVYLAASLLVGVAMARLIEIPVLALRDRWLPSVATPRASPSPRRDELAA